MKINKKYDRQNIDIPSCRFTIRASKGENTTQTFNLIRDRSATGPKNYKSFPQSFISSRWEIVRVLAHSDNYI